ncbi:MAG: PQQ-binding-like beta-propeller repeat protein [Phycisphaeraceae bacterium]
MIQIDLNDGNMKIQGRIEIKAMQIVGDDGAASTAPPQGASLNTDSEVDSHLRRAAEYIEEGKHHEAILVMQHVIDTAGHVLTTRDGRTYQPVTEAVEQALAQLKDAHPQAFAVYRAQADSEARALMLRDGSPGSANEKALEEVLRRYFISAWGDDAAMALGGLMMDRYDFAGARRLFRKVLLAHPDPDVDQVRLLLSLAVASAQSGDRTGVADALARLERLLKAPHAHDGGAGLGRQAAWIEQVRRAVAADARLAPSAPGPQLPAALDIAGQAALMTRLWEVRTPLITAQSIRTREARLKGGFGNQRPQRRPELITRWRDHGWFPTAQVVTADGRICLVERDRVVCYDVDSGELLWETPEAALEQAQSRQSERAAMMVMLNGNLGLPMPTTPEEVALFGDRTATALTLIDQTLYHLRQPAGSWGLVGQTGRRIETMQSNTLIARDLSTGQSRWERPAGDLGPAADRPARWLATPVLCGDRLLAPLEQNTGQYLAALDRDSGQVIWRTYLCSAVVESDPWTPLAVAVDGNDVFVLTAQGVVMALDGADGALRWASRYERGLPETMSDFHPALMRRLRSNAVSGWDDNTILVQGDRLIVMPADSSALLCLDRSTGQVRYQADKGSHRYGLGVIDQRVVVAGPDGVACYRGDDATGAWQLLWRADVDDSHGRGVLTQGAVYVPEQDHIVCLDLATGRRTSVLHADTPRGDPVGNLFYDGQQLLVRGLDQTYMLVDSAGRMRQLTARIAQAPHADPGGAGPARLERAALSLRLGDMDAAITDYQAVLASLATSDKRYDATQGRLLDCLLLRARDGGDAAGGMLDSAQSLATTQGQKLRLDLARAAAAQARGDLRQAIDLYTAVAVGGRDLMVPTDDAPPASSSPAAASGQALASALAAEALEQLASRHGALVANLLQERGKLALEQAIAAGGGVDDLLAVSRAYPNSGASLEAAVLAARRARDAGRFDQGELILQDVARSAYPPRAAAGLVALARYHQDQRWTRQAADDWRLLAQRYPQLPVMADGRALPAAQIAEQALVTLKDSGNGIAPVSDVMTGAPNTMAWKEQSAGLTFVDLAGDPPPGSGPASQFLTQHVGILDGQQRLLTARNVHSGKVAWQVRLPRVQGDSDLYGGAYLDGGSAMYAGGGVLRDGHVGLILGDGRMVGIDLSNGMRRWELADEQDDMSPLLFDDAELSNSGEGRPARLDVGLGLLVRRSVNEQTLVDQVEAYDLATATSVWRRRFEHRAVSGVRIAAGYVNLVMDGGRSLLICDPRTGERRGEVSLVGRVVAAPLIWLPDGVIYSSSAGYVCRNIPSGLVRWVLEPKSRNTDAAVLLNDKTLGLLWPQGGDSSVWLIDVRSGAKRVLPLPGSLTGPVSLAGAPDGTQVSVLGMRRGGGVSLAVLDVATGAVQAVLDLDHRSGRPPSPQLLTLGGPIVPVLEYDQPQQEGRRVAGVRWRLAIYRKSDGKKVGDLSLGDAADGEAGAAPLAVVGTPVIRDGVLLVATQQGLVAFTHDPEIGTGK